MRWLQRTALATVLVGGGYLMGAWQIGRPGDATAQESQTSEISDETKKKLVGVQEALAAAAQALKDENRLVPATKAAREQRSVFLQPTGKLQDVCPARRACRVDGYPY